MSENTHYHEIFVRSALLGERQTCNGVRRKKKKCHCGGYKAAVWREIRWTELTLAIICSQNCIYYLLYFLIQRLELPLLRCVQASVLMLPREDFCTWRL